jgi:hypothetical protein
MHGSLLSTMLPDPDSDAPPPSVAPVETTAAPLPRDRKARAARIVEILDQVFPCG